MSELCSYQVSEAGGLELTGELTFESTPGLFRQTFDMLSGNQPPEHIDLSGINNVDSAGLALLLEWKSQRNRAGGKLDIFAAPDNLLSLARLCEAVELLQLSGRAES